jgi:hypothetical protein
MMSKTRVAPARQFSLPRLELCGSVLLAQLITTVKNAINFPVTRVRAWTDSTVVLGWLRKSPSLLQTFVTNRVTEATSHIPIESWIHIAGIENPADCASRGLTPDELLNHSLWWNGPSWLKDDTLTSNEPSLTPDEQDEISREERKTVTVHAAFPSFDFPLLDRYSSLQRISRITCWILRFKRNSMVKTQNRALRSEVEPLTYQEQHTALLILVQKTQQQSFPNEMKGLLEYGSVSTTSSLLRLNPFLDEHGILRVGGRLRHPELPPDQKHNMLLPRHSRLTSLIIWDRHISNCHAGPQQLQSIIQQFWIIRARDAVRFQLRKCLKCTRHSAKTMQQFMGDLPSSRVDYAGPSLLRTMAPRSKIEIKCYLAIFVCFVTRAVHLEVVSSLSTDHFIAALRRFISRRGRPAHIYSDCGTNFVGAAKELTKLLQQSQNQLADTLSKDGIQWHFNPPGAPHFGGLWEAGVKSVKYHLHRIIGPTKLTFEEMTTLMTQIEACLKSRPLTKLPMIPLT